MRTALLALFAHVAACGALLADDAPELARKAQEVLVRHCTKCHGKVNPQSGLSVLDFKALTENGYVVGGKLNDSQLWERVSSNDDSLVMPPTGAIPTCSRKPALSSRATALETVGALTPIRRFSSARPVEPPRRIRSKTVRSFSRRSRLGRAVCAAASAFVTAAAGARLPAVTATRRGRLRARPVNVIVAAPRLPPALPLAGPRVRVLIL